MSISTRGVLSVASVPVSCIRLFSSTSRVWNADLKQYKSEFDELINYEKTPLKLKKLVYRPKHTEKVLRAELFDKKTGRPMRPAIHKGYPKGSLLNNYLKDINTFEELVEAKNYIRQLDSLTNYLNSKHLIHFIIKSGEFGMTSFGLKTVYNLTNFKFNNELIKFIYFIRLLKFDNLKFTDYQLLQLKLSLPVEGLEDARDSISEILEFCNYGSVLKNTEYSDVTKFNELTSSIKVGSIPKLPSFSEELNLGKKLKIYSTYKYDHLYLKKAKEILDELEERGVLPEELSTLLSTEITPFVETLDDLIYSIDGHVDFLTDLQERIKFPTKEAEIEEAS